VPGLDEAAATKVNPLKDEIFSDTCGAGEGRQSMADTWPVVARDSKPRLQSDAIFVTFALWKKLYHAR
jgi:hypothetical protein